MKKYIIGDLKLFLATVGFIFLAAFLEIRIAFMIQQIIDTGDKGSLQDFYGAVIYGLFFVVILFATNYIVKILQASLIKKSVLNLKRDIFSGILKKDIRSFQAMNSANYISVLTNDINIVEKDYFSANLEMIMHVSRLVLGSIAIFYINPYIALSIYVLGVATLAVPTLFSKGVKNRRMAHSKFLSDFTMKVKDLFAGFEVIKSFHIEDKLSDEYKKSNENVEESKFSFLKLSHLVDILGAAFGFLIFLTALSVGTYFVIIGDLTFGLLIAAVQLMNNITTPVGQIPSVYNRIQSVKSIEEKFKKAMEQNGNTKEFIPKSDFAESIQLKDVSFSYGPEKKVVNNISLSIEKGKKYAIVGGSGSGKSTLIKLLLGYFEDYDGEIKVDGRDVRQISAEDLYSFMSVIQQNVFMFDDTVKNNITLYKDFDENSLKNVLAQSGLNEMVKKLPNGLSYQVGENGANLSGGEKQRLSIARALIKGTPILILDEATSALDNKIASNIEKQILAMDDITSIVITHRLNKELLKLYDEIFVLDEGELVEQGDYYELMKNKKLFYSLCNIMGYEEKNKEGSEAS
ncbi:ABC transporter ATP-binding protein [Proteinivorax hydrogeniformans]|uniref:ABC transporter ATP-binding protein n=1 Tax=Proteinivorax hydrogeniformans TaxID=1826727 RepID=A0AAU8HSP6_9FIRM